ncbi:Uu.00g027070.m01.CDS01 [Anthostomella pinea]|uniref:Uu.00g027070.m01.CDS01 n=1 Tax=Anthostomella pinea TaxID=933095 RepID=A0AAI8V7I7_9PEZI|nr:Uu.00g027070.m01.CDS01 [Anthostomella pinea]
MFDVLTLDSPNNDEREDATTNEENAFILKHWRLYESGQESLSTASAITNIGFLALESGYIDVQEIIDSFGGPLALLRLTSDDHNNGNARIQTVQGILHHLVGLAKDHTTMKTQPAWPNFSKTDDFGNFYDQWTRNMRDAIRRGVVSFTLALTSIIIADTIELLGDKTSAAYTELTSTSSKLTASLDSIIERHKDLRTPEWPESADVALTSLDQHINESALRNPVHRAGRKHRWKLVSFNLYKSQPVLSGVILFSISTKLHSTSVDYVNAWGIILRGAHVYCACKETFAIKSSWIEMEHLLDVQPETSLFVGGLEISPTMDQPTPSNETPENRRLRRYCIATGASPALWSRGRRSKPQVVTSTGSYRQNRVKNVVKIHEHLGHIFEKGQWSDGDGQRMNHMLGELGRSNQPSSSVREWMDCISAGLSREDAALQTNLLDLHQYTLVQFQRLKDWVDPLIKGSTHLYYMTKPHEVKHIV